MNEIDRFLARPRAGMIGDLVEGFSASRLVFRLAGCGDLGSDPGLPGRLRGAFGDCLRASASQEAIAGQSCPWGPPCAFDMLFRNKGQMTRGANFGNPWVISAWPQRGDLVIELTLFGLALEWLAAAQAAFALAIRRTRFDQAARRPSTPRILSGYIDTVSLPDLPAFPIVLVFQTPLALDYRRLIDEPGYVFAGVGQRLEALARWHGLTLGAQSNAARDALQRLQPVWRDLEPVRWKRGSARQDRSIPMKGIYGELALLEGRASNDDLMLAQGALRLLQPFHLGPDAAFGCGRYQIRSG